MSSRRQLFRCFYIFVSVTAILLFLAQLLMWTMLQERKIRPYDPVLNNINLMRAQNLPTQDGKALIIGSSLTQRFTTTNDTIIASLPGQSSITLWRRIIPQNKYAPNTLFILEGNCITNKEDESVISATQTYSFSLGKKVPIFSMAAKPSNMFLSFLLSKTKLNTEYFKNEDEYFLGHTACVVAPMSEEAQEKHLEEYANECDNLQKISKHIKEMQAHSYLPCIVFYPSLRKEEKALAQEKEKFSHAHLIASKANIPLIDYREASFKNQLQFTDLTHLKSTAKTTSIFRNTILRDVRLYYGMQN